MMDTTIELQYEGGKLVLETRLPNAILSYPLGGYSNILLDPVQIEQAVAPAAVLKSNCNICVNRTKGLIKKATGLDIGPSVYWVKASELQTSLRTLSPVLIPDELPIEVLLELMMGTDFPAEVVWPEIKRIAAVREACGVKPTDMWKKMEKIAEELWGLEPVSDSSHKPN